MTAISFFKIQITLRLARRHRKITLIFISDRIKLTTNKISDFTKNSVWSERYPTFPLTSLVLFLISSGMQKYNFQYLILYNSILME